MGRPHVLENVGWVIWGAFLALTFLLLKVDGPEWLVTALLWVLFTLAVPLMFVQFRRRWREMNGLAAELDPIRFSAFLAGTVVFVLSLAAADMWLSSKIGWPEAYGFTCHGRGCRIDYLIHSPALLRGGSIYELSLFALLWFMPAILVGCAAYAIFKRRRRNPIQPMD